MLKQQPLVVLRVEQLRRDGRDPATPMLSSPEPGRDHRPAKGRRPGSESGPETPSPGHPCLRLRRGAGEGLRPLLPETQLKGASHWPALLDDGQVQGAQGQVADAQQTVQGAREAGEVYTVTRREEH